jgi:inorganic pyrophosphatase
LHNARFWTCIDQLVSSSEIVIDRPKGSPHPRYPQFSYPLDYGYLRGTTSGDGQGIDVWIGSLESKKVEGVICAVDLEKRDSETKILLACTQAEIDIILDANNSECFAGHLILRDWNSK